MLEGEIVWALHFVLRCRSPLLFFSWFLCSFRRWISLCHLPRSHCNTTRVINLGSYLLHHAVDSGHWQCSEYPHRHSQLHPFGQPNSIHFLCQITVFDYSQIYSLGGVTIQASTGLFSDLTAQDWLFLSVFFVVDGWHGISDHGANWWIQIPPQAQRAVHPLYCCFHFSHLPLLCYKCKSLSEESVFNGMHIMLVC